jgi:hypothetical protein
MLPQIRVVSLVYHANHSINSDEKNKQVTPEPNIISNPIVTPAGAGFIDLSKMIRYPAHRSTRSLLARSAMPAFSPNTQNIRH